MNAGEISPFGFKDRVEAAAKAGFKGIGIWHTDLEHTLQHHSLEEMKTILDDNGMKYVELEFLVDWFLTGARKEESDRRKRMLLEASAALGAKHVKVGDFYSTLYPMDQIVEAFAALCKEAEDFGATIGFEFMAVAMLNNLEESLRMVEAAGAKNGGLIVDIVHVVRIGIPYEQVSRIPLRYLTCVELNDGTMPENPNHDASGARKFCGEGDFDIKGFIQSIKKTGYTGPWAVEVISNEVAAMSLEEANTRAFETTMAQFLALS